MSVWGSELSHEDGGANTLYVHPVSGNALCCALYATEKKLNLKIHMIDIMVGEQTAEWFLALNPNHSVPTFADANGKGVWESGAILEHFAELAGEQVSTKSRMAMFWRGSVSKYFAGIYIPHLFGGPGDAKEGAQALKDNVESIFINRFLDEKFIGGETPSIADYHWATVFSMFTSSPYWDIADDRLKTWLSDFQTAVSCWGTIGAMQTGYVASKAQ
jgi:glutathione S-transferase